LENATLMSRVDGTTTPEGALTHLPFENQVDWSVLPELDEAKFAVDPLGTLHDFLALESAAPDASERRVRELARVRNAFVYGVGTPVRDDAQLGGAVEAIWNELQQFLFPHRRQAS
jgi:hypothetical protein